MDVTWELKKKNIKELKENDKNPRRLSKEAAKQLETSILKFGMCEPIVVNTDGQIIGGHQRVRTLKKLGHVQVDVFVPSEKLDEKDADELNIRLNRNTGEFDYDMLANEWDIDNLLDWGFTKEELHLEIDDEIDLHEEKNSPINITITLLDSENLKEIENKLSDMLENYPNATYKIKR